jgi:hypothetical protein
MLHGASDSDGFFGTVSVDRHHELIQGSVLTVTAMKMAEIATLECDLRRTLLGYAAHIDFCVHDYELDWVNKSEGFIDHESNFICSRSCPIIFRDNNYKTCRFILI